MSARFARCLATFLAAVLSSGSTVRAQTPHAPWAPIDETLPRGVSAYAATFDGPVRAFLAVVDLADPDLDFRPIVSKAEHRKESLTTLARANGAVVATNACYFDKDAEQCHVIGWLVVDGGTLSEPTSAVTQGKIGYAVARACVVWEKAVRPRLAWIRRSAGRVVELDAPVPNAESAPADRAAADSAGRPVAGVRHAVGAGPMLLRGGRAVVTRMEERMFVTDARHPRTALGLKGSTLFLVVVDGRSVESRGQTLDELAATLRDLGAEDAVNLDGGGSSTFVVLGRLRNRPEGGVFERPVPAGLAVVRRKPETPR